MTWDEPKLWTAVDEGYVGELTANRVNAAYDINALGRIGDFMATPISKWQLDALKSVDQSSTVEMPDTKKLTDSLKDLLKKGKLLDMGDRLETTPHPEWSNSNPCLELQDFHITIGRQEETLHYQSVFQITPEEEIRNLKADNQKLRNEQGTLRRQLSDTQTALNAERRFIANRTVLDQDQAEVVADLLVAAQWRGENSDDHHMTWAEYLKTVSKAETLLTIKVPSPVEAVSGMRRILEETA
jgi:hypothetical protein